MYLFIPEPLIQYQPRSPYVSYFTRTPQQSWQIKAILLKKCFVVKPLLINRKQDSKTPNDKVATFWSQLLSCVMSCFTFIKEDYFSGLILRELNSHKSKFQIYFYYSIRERERKRESSGRDKVKYYLKVAYRK